MEIKKYFDKMDDLENENRIKKMPIIKAYENNMACYDRRLLIEHVEEEITNSTFKIRKYRLEMAINMTADEYEYFSQNTVETWELLKGLGGSWCTIENENILSVLHDKCERKGDYAEFDEFIDNNLESFAVGIYRNGRLKMIVNPEGYNYAKYIMLPTPDYMNLRF